MTRWENGRGCIASNEPFQPATHLGQKEREDMMAELGHNYNIQCMKLFQELKAAYPATPDELVRQCMKAVSFNEYRNTCN